MRVHGGRGALGSATAAQALSSHVSAIFRMGLRFISSHRSLPFAATLWWIPSLKCNSSFSIYLCNEIIFLYLLFHVFSFHSPRKFSFEYCCTAIYICFPNGSPSSSTSALLSLVLLTMQVHTFLYKVQNITFHCQGYCDGRLLHGCIPVVFFCNGCRHY